MSEEEERSGLSGEEYEQLIHALVDAFPREDDLRRMLRFGLDKSLDARK